MIIRCLLLVVTMFAACASAVAAGVQARWWPARAVPRGLVRTRTSRNRLTGAGDC
jgi:hypothetical protein